LYSVKIISNILPIINFYSETTIVPLLLVKDLGELLLTNPPARINKIPPIIPNVFILIPVLGIFSLISSENTAEAGFVAKIFVDVTPSIITDCKVSSVPEY